MSESLGEAVLDLHANAAPLRREVVGAQAFTLASIKKTAMASKAGMAAAMAGVGLAVGAGLVAVGDSFDNAFDKIAAKTGSSGKNLERLKDDFREVFRTVPNSADEVATAIGEVHRSLDLVGRPLQERTRQLLTLSRITGTDLSTNIKTVARAFQDWEVPTKRQGKTLDGFLALSQKTGIAVDQLATQVVQFGAPLRSFGFDLEQAAAMFAGFEEAGVNMSTTMSGIRLGIGNIAQPTEELKKRLKELGVETAEPQEQFLALIKAMEDANTEQEALSIGIDAFGKRAANDMKEAVRQGRFEVEDLIGTFRKGKGAIADTAAETDDWREALQILRNKGMLAIEEPATMMIKALTVLAEGAGVAFDAFQRLPEPIKAAALALGVLAVAARLNPWVALVAGTIALVGLIKQKWPEIREAIQPVLDWMKTAFENAKNWLRETFGPVLRWFANAWRDVRDFVIGAWQAILSGIRWAVDKILGLFSSMLSAVADVVEELGRVPIIGDKFDDLADGIQGAADSIDDLRESMRKEEDQRERVEKGISSLERTARTKMGRLAGISEKSMDRVKAALAKGSKEGADALAREYDRAIGHTRKALKQGEIDTRKANKIIHSLMVKQLRVYGVKDPEVLISKVENAASGGKGGLQTGGFVVPGTGEGDKVDMHVGGRLVAKVEPGELIGVMNKNATAAVRNFAETNAAIPRHQAGGFVDVWGKGLAHLAGGGIVPVPGSPGEQMNSAVLGAWKAFQKRFNLFLTDAYGPGHQSAEHTQYGTAWDVIPGPGGSWADVDRAVAYAVRAGYTPVYYDGRFGSIDLPPHGPEHHAHITALTVAELLGGKHPGMGGFGAMLDAIALPRFEGLGAYGGAGAQGLNNISAALEERLNRGLGAMGGTEGPESSGHFAGQGSATQQEIERVWRDTNRFGDAHLMSAIAMGESRGDAGAIGNDPGGTTGLGWYQVTTGYNDDLIAKYGGRNAMLQPVPNTKAAGEILKRQGLGAWVVYSSGDYLNWMREGGLLELAELAKGGIAMVGDSLSVGMLGPGGGFPSGWDVRAKVGANTGWGIEQLSALFNDHAAAVFAMGGNDGSGSLTAANLDKLPNIIGKAGLALMTAHGMSAEGSINNAIRGFGRKDALADWDELASGNPGWFGSDPLHPNAAGYRAVQALVKDAGNKAKQVGLRRLDGSDSGQGGGGGPSPAPGGGSGSGLVGDGKGIRGLVDAFVTQYKATEGAGAKRKLISETAKRLKESKQLGIDKLSADGSDLGTNLKDLRSQSDLWGEWASNAGSLTTTDEDGNDIPGVFRGGSETEWLNQQLGSLFALRNALITASEGLEKVRKRVREISERVKKQLDKVKDAIKDGERERRRLESKRADLEKQLQKASDKKEKENKQIERQLDRETAKPKKKRDEHLIKQLRERLRTKSSEKDGIRDQLAANSEQLAELTLKQEERVKLRDALKGPISEAITSRSAALIAGDTTLSEELRSVQGAGVTKEWLPVSPDPGLLGGEIFDVQRQLRDLGIVPEKFTDTTDPSEGDTSTSGTGMSIDDLLAFKEAIDLGAFRRETISQLPTFHGGGVVGGVPPGTQEVLAKLLNGEGVIDAETMDRGVAVGPREGKFTITNWREGTGYFREVAGDEIAEQDRAGHEFARAGRRR